MFSISAGGLKRLAAKRLAVGQEKPHPVGPKRPPQEPVERREDTLRQAQGEREKSFEIRVGLRSC